MNPVSWDKLFDRQSIRHLSAVEKRKLIELICEGDPELVAQIVALLESAIAKGHVNAARTDLDALDETTLPAAIDDFRIISLVGEGPRSAVYLAQSAAFKSAVALKLFSSSEVWPNSQEHVGILRELQHPAIASIYGAGRLENGTTWLVREFVEGIGIIDFCKTHSLNLIDRLLMFRRVCEAVQHAHQFGIVHRDLKPSNILLNSEHALRILDFGVAKRPGRDRLSTEAIAYLAPEQAVDGPIGYHTDIFSLGVLFFQLVTGFVPSVIDPFGGPRKQSVWKLWRRGSFPSIEMADAMLDIARPARSELNRLYAMATEGDIRGRYQSIEPLLQHVDYCLHAIGGLAVGLSPDLRPRPWHLWPEPAKAQMEPIEDNQPHSEPFQVERCSHPADVLQSLREGLLERAWMLDFIVGDPFMLKGSIGVSSTDELVTWFLEHPEVAIDISAFLRAPAGYSLVLLGQYPSGAIRGIPGTVEWRNMVPMLRLFDSICLLDPDSGLADVPLEGLSCTLNVVALREIHHD